MSESKRNIACQERINKLVAIRGIPRYHFLHLATLVMRGVITADDILGEGSHLITDADSFNANNRFTAGVRMTAKSKGLKGTEYFEILVDLLEVPFIRTYVRTND